MSVLTMAPTLGDLLKFELNASYTADSDLSGRGFRFQSGHPFRSVSGHLYRCDFGRSEGACPAGL
jgi:hypothetical protein